MAIRRLPTTDHADVLDRVLDKGIVIDARVKVSVAGLELVGIDANVIVASLPTYLRLCESLGTPMNVEALPRARRQARPSRVEPAAATSSDAPASPRPAISGAAASSGPTVNGAPESPRPVVRRRRVRTARTAALVIQRCAQGCSFTRSARRVPRSVQCPYDGARVCELVTA